MKKIILSQRFLQFYIELHLKFDTFQSESQSFTIEINSVLPILFRAKSDVVQTKIMFFFLLKNVAAGLKVGLSPGDRYKLPPKFSCSLVVFYKDNTKYSHIERFLVTRIILKYFSLKYT